MPIEVEHDGNFDQAQLQTNLRFNEGAWCKLTALAVRDGLTISTHDDVTVVPDNSLELILDPDGDATGPEGSTLICRGTVLIGGDPTAVATFRT